jgi:hypothetical protein
VKPEPDPRRRIIRDIAIQTLFYAFLAFVFWVLFNLMP